LYLRTKSVRTMRSLRVDSHRKHLICIETHILA
jgi:hypothetical protein